MSLMTKTRYEGMANLASGARRREGGHPKGRHAVDSSLAVATADLLVTMHCRHTSYVAHR